MNYSKSPTSSHVRGSPYGKQLAEGPIHDLAIVIEKTPQEDWKKRTQALSSLVATIPSGEDYLAEEAWYNSPPTLRHLAWPLAELLKDARSSVVIRACESCSELFGKCQMDARYLLKDLMPAILGIHAQTVAVIRTTVQDMVVEAMSVTPCKMAMPLWLDKLKSDKSRTVREACAMYLGVALREWTEEGYLSLQIWEQVGTALTKALRDPAPSVRQYSKKGLEVVNQQQPDIFDSLVGNSELVRDVRVRKFLQRIQAGESVADDVSVTSNRSHTSRQSLSHLRGSGGSVAGRSTPRGGVGATRSTFGSNGRFSSSSSIVSVGRSASIPKTIGVTTETAPAYAKTAQNSTSVGVSAAASSSRKGGGLGPPVRMAAVTTAAISSPPKIQRRTVEVTTLKTNNKNGEMTSTKQLNGITDGADDGETDGPPPIPGNNTSFDTNETNESDLPVIATADALREYAKTRGGSRRSSMLQERFARSQSQTADNDLDDILDNDLGSHTAADSAGAGAAAAANISNGDCKATTTITTTPSMDSSNNGPPLVSIVLPEHAKIANALLEAHKKHVDLIMETLKVEMDALKEFELVMLEEGPLRPTEDEVLEYFESVGLCVEQRAKAGNILLKKLDKISSGAL